MNSKHLVKKESRKTPVVRRPVAKSPARRDAEKVPVVWDKAFKDELALDRDMDRMLDEISEDFGIRPMWLREEPATAVFTPKIDIQETPQAILVRAELPGMDKDDLTLRLEGDALVIRGEKAAENEKRAKQSYHFERVYGSFERVIPLSTPVAHQKVEARLRNGVLSITLPKTHSERSHDGKIEVKAA
jgi:HSP20 family protein